MIQKKSAHNLLKKWSLGFVCATMLTLVSCDVLQQVATTAVERALTSEDIGAGLKEALNIGIGAGADALSQKGGYFNSAYKILLPQEARDVADRLRIIPGFDRVESILLEKINAGAEDAAARAKPIFLSAIRQMTISDALSILMGDKNAATEYLKRTTSQLLYNEFNPVIISSLDKFEARKYWSDAATAYNRIPLLSKKANPNLDEYVTNEALKGLFSMVEIKERDIRSNLASRTTDLLRRVFSKQDGK
jgi:hypothetical protein